MNLLGLLSALAAAVAFGIQYLPVKKYEIYDGTTFQWFMCNGILLTGFLVCAIRGDLEHGVSLLVAFGGVLWAFQNFLVQALVKLLGIGVGFSLYNFTNLCMGYLTGRLGLFGVPKTVPTWPWGLAFCDFGCALIGASFVVMTFVEPGTSEETAGNVPSLLPPEYEGIDEEYRAMYRAWRAGHGRGPMDRSKDKEGKLGFALEWMGAQARCTSFYGPFGMTTVSLDNTLYEDQMSDELLVDEQPSTSPARPRGAPAATGTLLGPRSVSEPAVAKTPLLMAGGDGGREAEAAASKKQAAESAKKVLGVSLALLAGVLNATCTVPSTLFVKANPHLRPTVPVFSMYLGLWFTSNLIYLGYASWAKVAGLKVRHAAIRPAYAAGCVWGLGFCGLITGISLLGFTVCYVICTVGPILVAGFLSIVVFHEITQRRQLYLYSLAFVLQVAGVVTIVVNGSGGT